MEAKRKEIALRNLDSLLEHDGFDQAAYFQKRNAFLPEIKVLDQKLKDTHKDLEELRQRKTEEAEFTKLASGADPFKTLTYKITNLPFADKYPLLRGILTDPLSYLMYVRTRRNRCSIPASFPGS